MDALSDALRIAAITLAEMRAATPDFDAIAFRRGHAPQLRGAARAPTACCSWCWATPTTSTPRTGSRSACASPSATAWRSPPRWRPTCRSRKPSCARWTAFREIQRRHGDKRHGAGDLVRVGRRGRQHRGAPGHLDALRRAQGGRERHPPGDHRRRAHHQVPHRRRAHLGAERAGQRARRAGDLAHQGDVGARHRRAPRAAGRPLQGAPAARRPRDRLPRLGHAERLRRGRGAADPRPQARCPTSSTA